MRKLFVLACLGTALAGVRQADAQVLESVLPNGVPGFDTAPGTTVLSRVHPGFEQFSAQIGGYTITPGLTEGFSYNTNVLGTVVDTRGSPEITTNPYVSVDRSYTDGDVNASGSFQNLTATAVPTESYNTDTVSIGASHNFGRDTLTAGFAHLDAAIVPSQLNFLGSFVPTPIQLNTFRGNYSTQFGRLDVTPTVTYTQYAVTNVVQNGVYQNNSIFDRNDVRAGVNFGYETSAQRQLLFIIDSDTTRFPETNPYEPQPNNYELAAVVGYENNAGGLFNYFILAGVETEQFQSGLYSGQTEPIAEGGIVYTPFAVTTLSLTGRHEIEQTDQPNAIGFTYDHIGFEIDHELRRNIILTGNFSYDDAVYTKTGASGSAISAGGNLAYRVNRGLTLNFNVGYSEYQPHDGARGGYSETDLPDGARGARAARHGEPQPDRHGAVGGDRRQRPVRTAVARGRRSARPEPSGLDLACRARAEHGPHASPPQHLRRALRAIDRVSDRGHGRADRAHARGHERHLFGRVAHVGRHAPCVTALCSSIAVAVIVTCSRISVTLSRMRVMDVATSTATACRPAISLVIRSVACADWPARFFTSDATTAKPRPASPARAASIVAFSASRLVWFATSRI